MSSMDLEPNQSKRRRGPVILLASMAAMAIIGPLVLWKIISQPIEERILVDEETQSIIWTRVYRQGIETDRLKWADIGRLDYVMKSDGDFEIFAIRTDGEAILIQEDTRALDGTAQHYAKVMERPLRTVDNTVGYHKLDD
jgi:hypothetical protein